MAVFLTLALAVMLTSLISPWLQERLVKVNLRNQRRD